MAINEGFIKEIEQESKATREMLKRITAETFDWKPHEKSMTMKRLSVLVADMFGWFQFEIDADELDFAKGYDMPDPRTTQDLVDFFEKRLNDGLKSLRGAKDAKFSERWKLRRGENIFMETSKLEIVRMTINHMVHHRGQLSVFMRLQDIALPPIYGPTADEGQM
jgi:uncharacterized damage-inducible protein DinB